MKFFANQKGATAILIVVIVVIALIFAAIGYFAGNYYPTLSTGQSENIENANLPDVNENINASDDEPKVELLLDTPVDNFVIKDDKIFSVKGVGPKGAKIVAMIRNQGQSTTERAEQQMLSSEEQFSFNINIDHLLPDGVILHLEARSIEGKLLTEKDIMGTKMELSIVKKIEWADYINTNYNYKLKYPKDFSLQIVDSRDGSETSIGYNSIFWSKENYKDYIVEGYEVLKPGIYSLSVNYRDKTLQEYLDKHDLIKQEKIKVGGIEADKYVFKEPFGNWARIFVKNGDDMYGINFFENDDEQKEISKEFIESFEFIKEEVVEEEEEADEITQEEACSAEGGSWKEFSSGCGDHCINQRSEEPMDCIQVFTYSCNCSNGCWNVETMKCEPI